MVKEHYDKDRTIKQIKEDLDESEPTQEEEEKARKLAEDKGADGTIYTKYQLCGKYCSTCPHGPYAYCINSQNEWTYLGKISSAQSRLSESALNEDTETEQEDKVDWDADLVVRDVQKNGKYKIQVDYEDRNKARNIGAEWSGNNWLIDKNSLANNLDKIQESDNYDIHDNVLEEIDGEGDIEFDTSVTVLGSREGKVVLDVDYEDKNKIKDIFDAEWNDEAKSWEIEGSKEDIIDKLKDNKINPLESNERIIDKDDDYLYLSTNSEIEGISYVKEEKEHPRRMFDIDIYYIHDKWEDRKNIIKKYIGEQEMAKFGGFLTNEEITSRKI